MREKCDIMQLKRGELRMEIYKFLQSYMKEHNLKIAEVARICGLPDSTVRGIITRKQKSVALEVAFKLSDGLNVSLEKLNGTPERKRMSSISLTLGEHEIIKKYRNLDDHGKKVVDILLNEETERMSKEAENETPVIELRRYFAPVSAGTGVELEPYENFENIEVYSNVYTRRASFCLTVRGDSMEPRFHNDDIIMVAELEDVEIGDIGVFIVDGQGYLKIRGEYDLISLNPAYDNIHVSYEQMNRAIGKVVGVLDPDWIKNN